MVSASTLAQEASPRAMVGAIRWDAWTGGGVTEQVERTLGPAKYHDRLPWFAEVVAENTVRIQGGRQEIMDREIDYAAQAGLDYWAFLLYPESSTMSESLKLYLASAHRQRVKFCLILHNAFGVAAAEWPKERDRTVALLQEPGYQTVLGGRPLVYVFALQYQGAFPTERFADFRRAAGAAGIDPYCVYMGWNPAGDFRDHAAKGFAAVSAYAHGSSHAQFSQLAQAVETRYWQAAAEAGVPCIPLVTTGWDKRPRQENPVSWEIGHGYHQQEVFPSVATPEEIAAHLGRALDFVRQNTSICPANAVIVYAWNEHDEGGWLVPTRNPDGSPDTSRLDAVGKILAPGRQAEGQE